MPYTVAPVRDVTDGMTVDAPRKPCWYPHPVPLPRVSPDAMLSGFGCTNEYVHNLGALDGYMDGCGGGAQGSSGDAVVIQPVDIPTWVLIVGAVWMGLMLLKKGGR